MDNKTTYVWMTHKLGFIKKVGVMISRDNKYYKISKQKSRDL
jgi:hypothetical protein